MTRPTTISSLLILLIIGAGCGSGTVISGYDADADGDVDGDGDGDGDGDCGVCDDGVVCTVDSCVGGACYHEANDDLCPNGRCDRMLGCLECLEPGDCDDLISCTTDGCEAGACVHTADDDLCAGDLFCDASSGCVGCSGPEDCDDAVECTLDSCEASVCQNLPDHSLCPSPARRCVQGVGCVECQSSAECDDGIDCNGTESCVEASCVSGDPVDCDDSVACTVDSCSEAGGGSCSNSPDDTLCPLGHLCDPRRGCVVRQTFFAHTSSTLYEIDLEPVVPTARVIGEFGAGITMTDIAATVDGTLYGVSFSAFYEIDPETAAATLIGPLDAGESINGLTVAPDGTLYAGSNVTSGGTLFRVNPTTGAATAVGGFGEDIHSSGDIVWGPYSAIYAPDPDGDTDWLVSINPASGAATVMFDTGYTDMYGLTYTGGELIGLCGSGELLLLDVDASSVTVITDLDITWWGAS